jgi:hypothetical protein
MPSVLEEKDAIRELLARYCFHFDTGEFDEWLTLFTDDGAFEVSGIGRFTGREALREFLKGVPLTDGRPMIKHYVMNSVVHVDGDCAHARSYVIVVHAGEAVGISVAGRYADQLVKVGGEWRFKERTALLDFMTNR